MAVASTASVVILPCATHGHGEARVVVMDAQAMRTVAGALAAAARDLLTSGQPDSVLPSLEWTDELAPPDPVRFVAVAPLHDPARHLLSERLLDLPPPVC